MGIGSYVARRLGLVENRSTQAERPPMLPGVVPPSRRDAGEDPRGLDAVYRAVQLLETSARQLSIRVWRGSEELGPDRRAGFLNRPDVRLVSFGAFVAETVSSLAQRGNAFWRVTRDGYAVENVEVLDPLRVSVSLDKYGRPVYSLDSKPLARDEIAHLRLTHTPGEPLGAGPLQACISRVNSALETASYADNWTRKGSVPSGILTTDKPLTAEQASQYKTAANRTLQYENGIGVIGGGLKYEPLKLTPRELQFIEARREDTLSVARMFGIPARMMLATVEGGSDTYTNLEQENAQFIKQTLMAYLEEIEDHLTDLAPNGQTVRFNLDGFLRPDTLTRYQAHEIGIRAGFLTVNEARAHEGLAPIGETE